jgi:hypothetical protein
MGAETSASDLTEQTNPKPPSDVTEALLHQEIRSALARMSDAERFRAVREAVSRMPHQGGIPARFRDEHAGPPGALGGKASEAALFK